MLTYSLGRALCNGGKTPIGNLYMTLMDRMAVPVEHFGDATGQLKGVDLS
jgi:hypothetical protein